ncbi:sensor domain-containing diguanylate cyclase [Methylobacterium sp. WL120]|uniref:sensor domain-containing diguanylate cyclase n=2 Tax=unclassified Methylobacterium TaxID=2615210 RepID=UPI001FEFF49D|nr:sensor domain-containing diguanylate cyclase [Methylobacterium sp. WL120]
MRLPQGGVAYRMTGLPTHAAAAASATLRSAEAQLRLIRRDAERLAERQRSFDQAAAAAGIGLWECRLHDEALDWSSGVYDLFGIPRGTALSRGRTLEHYPAASRRALEAARTRAIAERTGFRLDAEIRTAAGQLRWIRLTATVEARAGVAVRLFGIKQDVTEERLAAEAARRRAEVDGMTGLANRMCFEDRLAALCRAGAGLLVLVDLDGFKAVNDGFGHAAGDACLREAARRLAGLCRRADLVARIGGDEFAILLGGDCAADAAEALAARIVGAVGRPMQVGGVTIRVGASVGIAALVGGGPADAFARADAALYAAKRAGRNTFRTHGAPIRLA